MKEKQQFTIQSLLAILAGNVILLAVLLFGGVEPLIGAGIGLVLTFGLWFVVKGIGTRLIDAATTGTQPVIAPAPEPPKIEKPAPPSYASAIQILSILQRKGRLIDFLQEDLSTFDDAQIGAAVRNIHEGSKEALAEYLTLEPIMDTAEGSTVNIDSGFDATTIRLTGNVVGDPPFNGTVQHRGWRVAHIALPELIKGAESKIVAPAEVEVNA